MKASTKAVGLLLLVLLAVPASAQTLVGSVTGKVTDEQGAALPGVSITLTGKTGSKATVLRNMLSECSKSCSLRYAIAKPKYAPA